MPGLPPNRLEHLLSHCKEKVSEVAELVGPHFGVSDLTIEVGEAQAGLAGLSGAVSEKTALAVIREWADLFTLFYLDPGPLSPDWWGDSMAGQEHLAVLTTALANLVSPMEPRSSADLLWEKSLADAADLHDFPEDVTVIPFELISGENKGHAFLVILETASGSDEATPPESRVEGQADSKDAEEERFAEPPEKSKTVGTNEPPEESAEPSRDELAGEFPPMAGAGCSTAYLPHGSLNRLPVYARSLLHVKVPVVVTLATKKESVSDILNLCPGAILQFKKSCEEPLDLSVGARPIARGEAVKVGEKFGLRIMSMLLPSDRYITLKPKADAPPVNNR